MGWRVEQGSGVVVRRRRGSSLRLVNGCCLCMPLGSDMPSNSARRPTSSARRACTTMSSSTMRLPVRTLSLTGLSPGALGTYACDL